MKPKACPIPEDVYEELDSTLDSFGFELVELKLGGRGAGRTLTLSIDKPGGVTLGDCQYMSSRLSVLLDALDPVSGRYTLVISSPGVNRPLTRDTDFDRFTGERVTVRAEEPEGGRRSRDGVLTGTKDGNVVLDIDGEEVLIPLVSVEAANIIHDWDETSGEDSK